MTKLKNVRTRQRRRYRKKHYAYMRQHKAKLTLPWSAYNYKFTAEQRIEINQMWRWMNQ